VPSVHRLAYVPLAHPGCIAGPVSSRSVAVDPVGRTAPSSARTTARGPDPQTRPSATSPAKQPGKCTDPPHGVRGVWRDWSDPVTDLAGELGGWRLRGLHREAGGLPP